MPELTWEDFETEAETITVQDEKNIEEGLQGFLGKAICRVVESSPRQIDFSKYSCVGVRLKFEVEQVLQIGEKKMAEKPRDDMDYIIVYRDVKGDEAEHFEGKTLTDDVALYHENEKDGMAKRRKFVALRLGIVRAGETIIKGMWRDDVIGRRVILTTEENMYKDNSGKLKIGYPKVAFFGYEAVGKAGPVKEESYDDI